jgi:hypothetical protein
VVLAVLAGCGGAATPTADSAPEAGATTTSVVAQVTSTTSEPVPTTLPKQVAVTTAPGSVETFTVDGGPAPIAVPVVADAPPPAPVAPAWSLPSPGSSIGEIVATADLVAVSLPSEHLVVAYDRVTGTERWRRDVSPEATVPVNATRAGIVIDERDAANVSTWTEIDSAGGVRFATEFDQTHQSPRLDIRPDGLYQTTVFEANTVRRTVIDPATGVVETSVGDPYREQWDGLVVVGPDGTVSTRRGLGEPLQPTAIALGPDVTSVALVDDRVAAYGGDELRAFSLDGALQWTSTYDGDGTLTEVFATSPQGPRFAIVTPPDRLDIVDVDLGVVVLSTTIAGAAFPTTWPDRLVAEVEPNGDGSVGLLDLLLGELTVAPSLVGRLVADPASPWVDAEDAGGTRALFGLGASGELAWTIDVDATARIEPVAGGAVVVSGDDETITMFEFPVTRPTG